MVYAIKAACSSDHVVTADIVKPWAHSEPWSIFDSKEPEGSVLIMQIFCMSNTLGTVDVLYLHCISSGSKPILFIEDLSLYAWRVQ